MALSKEAWEKQYAEGKWDYLNSPPESARYAVVGKYGNQFHPLPSVLDIGCGFGTLAKYLRYRKYVGIDLSQAALDKADMKENCRFVCISAEEFRTEEKFDIVIFNEILYYIDAFSILKKYESYMCPDGFFIISLWEHPKTKVLWEKIMEKYACIDSVGLSHGQSGNKWSIGMFKPSPSRTE